MRKMSLFSLYSSPSSSSKYDTQNLKAFPVLRALIYGVRGVGGAPTAAVRSALPILGDSIRMDARLSPTDQHLKAARTHVTTPLNQHHPLRHQNSIAFISFYFFLLNCA